MACTREYLCLTTNINNAATKYAIMIMIIIMMMIMMIMIIIMIIMIIIMVMMTSFHPYLHTSLREYQIWRDNRGYSNQKIKYFQK